MSVHVFGIRHHGPGCARSLVQALQQLQPDAIVIEAPADAEPALSMVAEEGLVPPVALLIARPDQPRESIVYPLANFSPEWQAMRWGVSNQVPLFAMDLPMTHRFAINAAERTPSDNDDIVEDQEQQAKDDESNEADEAVIPPRWRTDPLALLAEAAGYTDHELWWEEQIERRHNASDLFEGIQHAMEAIRAEEDAALPIDLMREAFMRKTLRQVSKQGFQKIAVVCGAWHAPVLSEQAIQGKLEGCRIKDDTALLRGLPKVKTSVTWIPWSYSRLATRSGYGAGVSSPGWYNHLWEYLEQAPIRWLIQAAQLLREKDLSASSADVIEASRLAETLSSLRDLRSPGMAELNEAILSVYCQGDHAPLRMIHDQLEIGDRLGAVPASLVNVPLDLDVRKQQKSLRLKPETSKKLLDLDLRQANGQARSRMLHRLNLLGIPWGMLQNSQSDHSNFHEIWELQWQPEFSIAIIEANIWGSTLEEAAIAKLTHQIKLSSGLVDLVNWFDQTILAGLGSIVPSLVVRLQQMAATTSDLLPLMESVLPLTQIWRYGDVRETPTETLEPVLIEIIERILIGLSVACHASGDEQAEQLLKGCAEVHQALSLLPREHLKQGWNAQLRLLAESEAHGQIRGWCCRRLLESGELSDDDFERLVRLSVSSANGTAAVAAWISGLLDGSGLLLLHQQTLWSVLNEWLMSLEETSFLEVLPLMRRGFADFSAAERRRMSSMLTQLSSPSGNQTSSSSQQTEQTFDADRAALVMPVLAMILGGTHDSTN